ncbi:uncharacterized protein LOC123365831 isoform X2 [Mauremys mutica]|uniref:uncharacterized protein LOC123365831 isoform X2 n=1 Tax=Mauremys mutica TaxID=74926 RepID=UPI001D165354|nr:uncharacterized protein LOC123365831 isoform X2 [Mauremys mutica]
MGIGGKPFECSVLQEAAVEISGVSASHAFLLAPDSPVNLLGRDLLCKLRAQIFFSADKIILRLPQNQLPQLCATLTQATEDPILPASPMDLPERLRREVHASLWGTSKTNLGTLRTEPVRITLKSDIDIPRIRQYPIPQQALLGLRDLINTFLWLGVLIRTLSPFKTPILPVRKPDLDPEGKPVYRFVQDLRAVNRVVQARHNVIPNPHTILTAIPADGRPDHRSPGHLGPPQRACAADLWDRSTLRMAHAAPHGLRHHLMVQGYLHRAHHRPPTAPGGVSQSDIILQLRERDQETFSAESYELEP